MPLCPILTKKLERCRQRNPAFACNDNSRRETIEAFLKDTGKKDCNRNFLFASIKFMNSFT